MWKNTMWIEICWCRHFWRFKTKDTTLYSIVYSSRVCVLFSTWVNPFCIWTHIMHIYYILIWKSRCSYKDPYIKFFSVKKLSNALSCERFNFCLLFALKRFRRLKRSMWRSTFVYVISVVERMLKALNVFIFFIQFEISKCYWPSGFYTFAVQCCIICLLNLL